MNREARAELAAIIESRLRGTDAPADWGVPDDYAHGWVAALHQVQRDVAALPEPEPTAREDGLRADDSADLVSRNLVYAALLRASEGRREGKLTRVEVAEVVQTVPRTSSRPAAPELRAALEPLFRAGRWYYSEYGARVSVHVSRAEHDALRTLATDPTLDRDGS